LDFRSFASFLSFCAVAAGKLRKMPQCPGLRILPAQHCPPTGGLFIFLAVRLVFILFHLHARVKRRRIPALDFGGTSCYTFLN